jgi:UDP-galactopyranose mutase
MPAEGFTRMFERILCHANIRVELGVSFEEIKQKISAKLIFYSGPIDEYFDFCYGRLPYRSLEFQHEHLAGVAQYQPVGAVNYPNDHRFTRITEFKHLTGQRHSGTSIVREFPKAEGDPYYPIPTAENQEIYEKYSRLAQCQRDVFFVGRLAEYRYYNMDQVVAAALRCFSKLQDPG